MSRIRKWLKDFLERLAKAGEEEFHNRPPSCCGTLPNRQQRTKGVVPKNGQSGQGRA